MLEAAPDSAKQHWVARPAPEAEWDSVEKPGERVLRVEFSGIETQNRSITEGTAVRCGSGITLVTPQGLASHLV